MQKDDWAQYLPTAEFAYNNAAHKGIKETPFFLEYGHHPRAGPTIVKTPTRVDLNDIFTARAKAQEQAKAALALAAERMKWYYDLGTQAITFKVGNKVLLDMRDYQTSERSLAPRYKGPFVITDKVTEVIFRIEMPPQYRGIHPVFHASKLQPYTSSVIPGQVPPPPKPVKRNGHIEYEVAKILQHRVNRRKNEYLVQWKGYGDEENTWEPQKNLEPGARQVIEEFHHKQGDKAPWEIQAQELIPKDDDSDFDRFAYRKLQYRDSTLQVQLDGGKLPVRGSTEAAGLDLHSSQNITLPPHFTTMVSTGIRIKLPIDTYGRIALRSSLALKGITINSGVVDQDYTGEIRVILVNTSDFAFPITTGDRIAQLIVERIAMVDIQQVKQLDNTARGEGGFGSTGR